MKYKNHKRKWNTCERCDLCETRRNVVLARGVIPADIMFVGEAPGESEDVLGKPFIGPAGKLFDKILSQVLSKNTRYLITNLVACIPRDEHSKKAKEPSVESINACAPRLLELFTMCEPQVVVCVGTLAKNWAPSILGKEVRYVSMIHPAAILKADTERKGVSTGITIKNTIIHLLEELDVFL